MLEVYYTLFTFFMFSEICLICIKKEILGIKNTYFNFVWNKIEN